MITARKQHSITPPKGGWGVLLLFCALLISCGTKKQATTSLGNIPTQETVTPAEASQQNETCITSKLRLDLSSSGKSFSAGGVLRMKRNDVIQLSIITFGIIEVARIEMTPDYFMIINKLERQYVKAAYDDVPFLKRGNIDFRTLQAFFWNEQTPSIEAWERTDFVSLGEWNLPTKHLITVPYKSGSAKATLTLSNLKVDSEWEKRTQVPDRYTEVPASELLSRLMNMKG